MSLPPTFISMNPLYGFNGTTITIVGENITNNAIVSMNGTTIPLTNQTSENISFVAPSGTGSMTVRVSDVNSIGMFIYTYQDSQGIVNYSFQTPSVYNDGYYHYINTYYKSLISPKH
jgi:hypothetical protein